MRASSPVSNAATVAATCGMILLTLALAAPASLPRSALAQQDPVEPGARIERVATGYQFTEGPAVYRDGTLFFSDVPASEIHTLAPDGRTSRYRTYTGRGNGLYFDSEWRLIACEMQYQRLSRDDLEGNVETVVDRYEGRPFNAPNDLWIHPEGGIYFTDPDFAGSGAASAVYFVPPDGGNVARMIDDIMLPNGVIGTPNGDTLYVADYRGAGIFRYRIGDGGMLGGKHRFTELGGDGMTLDERGNVYLAADDGQVWIFNPEGQSLRTIDLPEEPSNVTFGGPEGRTLFITAETSVYSLRMAVRGAFAPGLTPQDTPTPPEPSATPETATAPATATATEMVPVTPTATLTGDGFAVYLPITYRE